MIFFVKINLETDTNYTQFRGNTVVPPQRLFTQTSIVETLCVYFYYFPSQQLITKKFLWTYYDSYCALHRTINKKVRQFIMYLTWHLTIQGIFLLTILSIFFQRETFCLEEYGLPELLSRHTKYQTGIILFALLH